jgi:hypothetical protein
MSCGYSQYCRMRAEQAKQQVALRSFCHLQVPLLDTSFGRDCQALSRLFPINFFSRLWIGCLLTRRAGISSHGNIASPDNT